MNGTISQIPIVTFNDRLDQRHCTTFMQQSKMDKLEKNNL